jgi:large subunit ribosomal protein L6
MSKIGKKPILIPEGVKVEIGEEKITVSGPMGKLEKKIDPRIGIEIKEGKIFLFPKKETKETKALWGTTRSLLANLVEGVTKGFEKKLEIEGLGYRASLNGQELILEVGYSHPVKLTIPSEIKISVEKNVITLFGPDKELVGQTAAKIKRVKPAEPYKGKGIKYFGEKIRRKISKKVAATG